jgi:hypothetical protein
MSEWWRLFWEALAGVPLRCRVCKLQRPRHKMDCPRRGEQYRGAGT